MPTPSPPDPAALRAYSFLLAKLSRARWRGMVHLGDRMGLYRAMDEAGAPVSSTGLASPSRPGRALGEGVGLQPGRSRADRDRRRRAAVALARGGGRAGRCLLAGLRHGPVPPGSPGWRGRWRSCRPPSERTATTTTATAPTARWAWSGRSSPGAADSSSRSASPTLEGVAPAQGPDHGRRRLRGRRGGVPDGRGLPGQPDPRLQHLPPRARTGAAPHDRPQPRQRPLPRRRRSPSLRPAGWPW